MKALAIVVLGLVALRMPAATTGTLVANFRFVESRFGPPIAATPDGAFLTVTSGALHRFGANGQLDDSWSCAIDSIGQLSSVEVAPDGCIFAAGSMSLAGRPVHVVKLRPSGLLDTDFPAGRVTLAFDPFRAGIALVRPDADGGCYVHGYFDSYNGQPATDLVHIDRTGVVTPWLRDRSTPLGGGWELAPDRDSLIVVGPDKELNRVHADGSIEPFARPGGIEWSYIAGAAFDSRWGLAIVGSSAVSDSTGVTNICAVYDIDGTLRATFGQHVVFDVVTGGGDCIAWDNQGRLLVGYARVLADDENSDGSLFGFETSLDGFGQVVFTPSVKRLLPNGRLDPNWSRALWFNLAISRITVLPDDDVLVAGTFNRVCGHSVGSLVRITGGPPRENHPQQSARGYVEAGRQQVIMGLVIDGDRAVDVLVRAAGPSLLGFGVRSPAFATRFAVYRGRDLFVRSPGGGGQTVPVTWTADRVSAFPFIAGPREASMLLSLLPGAYTIVVDAREQPIGFGDKGEVLGEIYFP